MFCFVELDDTGCRLIQRGIDVVQVCSKTLGGVFLLGCWIEVACLGLEWKWGGGNAVVV